MLLRRILIPLVLQHGQRLDQLLTRLARLDNGADAPGAVPESAAGRDEGLLSCVTSDLAIHSPNR
jgi:hypothetical protein